MEFTDLLGFIPGPEVGGAASGEKNDESFTQTEKPGAGAPGEALSRTNPLSNTRTPAREGERMGEGKT
jgi:hypothetical protein